MESPTPLSENNLRRYKGIRASKKSLYSCTDFYYKGDTEQDNGEDGELLGPRSVSLFTICSPSNNLRPLPGSNDRALIMGNGGFSQDSQQPSFQTALVPEPVGKGRNSTSSSMIEPNRMTQLETLEAKMASIEVSLANVAAAAQLQQQQPVHRRMKRVGGGSRSHLGVPATSSRDIHKEMDFLRQSLKDKENLILNLQTQLRKLSKRKMTHGSITSTDSGVVSLRILSENERKAAEERLAQLDKDMELKRAEIKNITSKLERLDPSDNIDTRIQQAELEYELEREELNLMNLQEERRNLHTILDDNDAFQKRTENSLFTSLPLNSYVALHSFEVVYDASEPSFTVGKREDRSGTYITWTRDEVKTLKRGDRIVEINGTIVISKGVNRLEEFWADEDNNVDEIAADLDFGAHPLRVVVMRAPPPPPPPRAPNRELHTLKEELSLVTARLEQVSGEKRELQGLWQKVQKDCDAVERLKSEHERVVKERDLSKTEGVRLKHRISYLEEQVADLLQQKKEACAPSSVTVFQKGSHKAIVAEPNKKRSHSPNQRPPSVASSNNKPCEARQALKTRLWETFRRATSSDSRSVCSIDSHSAKHDNGYRKGKPPPPTKPVRLSLQRATSSSEVYSGDIPDLNPGLRRSNCSENTLIPDNRSDIQVSRKKRGKHHGIRWPSLRPASSMSYAMGCGASSGSRF